MLKTVQDLVFKNASAWVFHELKCTKSYVTINSTVNNCMTLHASVFATLELFFRSMCDYLVNIVLVSLSFLFMSPRGKSD